MPESILIVYVHGYAIFIIARPDSTLTLVCSFKGTDVTFEEFPERLRHVVYESVAHLESSAGSSHVESKVFPVFETKGELVSHLIFPIDKADVLPASRDRSFRRMADKRNDPPRVVDR